MRNNKCLDRLKLKASTRRHVKPQRPCLGPNSYRARSPGVVLSGFPWLGRTRVVTPDLNLTPDSPTRAVTRRSSVHNLDLNAEPIEDSPSQNPSESVSVHGVSSDSGHTSSPPTSSSSAESNRVSERFGFSFGESVATGSSSRTVTDDRRNHLDAPPGFENYRAPTSVAQRRRKPRGDTASSSRSKPNDIMGAITGVEIGKEFSTRKELFEAGLHGQWQAGISFIPAKRSGYGKSIATSIVFSGGYEDNEDRGDVLVYSGHGGQDKRNRQCRDQELKRGNIAMVGSYEHEITVRVIREIGSKYVYDGLYVISHWWTETGKSGFKVYKFRLVRFKEQSEMGSGR